MEKIRILVIEDNSVIALVIKYSMMHLDSNIEVVVAGSAEQGEKLFKEGSWNMLIVGYQLPGKDGLSMVRDLVPILGSTRWIMISGSTSDELRLEVKRLGGYNYLVEPFSLTELKNAVWGALDLAPAQMEL
jgi:DNA-binding response OmpR family regulator